MRKNSASIERKRTSLSKDCILLKEALCTLQGHTWADWKCEDGPIDRTWIYTRYCEVCENKETSFDNEPKEYQEQQRRTREKNSKN